MLNESLSTAVPWKIGAVFCCVSNYAILCSAILNIPELCVCMVDLANLESDCKDCDFLSECIGVVNDILSEIEVVGNMFLCVSFEGVTILSVTSFVFPCLLDIVYIVSSYLSYGVPVLMTYALVDLYVTYCLREKDISSDPFTSE